MGTTHASRVKAEAAKAASGLHRVVGVGEEQVGGSGRWDQGPESSSWIREPESGPSGRQVNLQDLIVAKL